MGELMDRVRAYYDALNTGEPDQVASHFTEDAVHYYTRLGPDQGARAIAERNRMQVADLGGRWSVENGIEQGDQACIEWTMTWRDPETGERRLDRGAEWFLFRDGKIAEVRAYFHGGRRNRSGDLIGFDHAGRGHTVL